MHLNIRCPNCGAVFPGPSPGREAECPLCLHSFTPDGNATVSASGAPQPAPSSRAGGDDDFESFGEAMGSGTSTFGSNAGSQSGSDFSASSGSSFGGDGFGGNSNLADDGFEDMGSPSGAGDSLGSASSSAFGGNTSGSNTAGSNTAGSNTAGSSTAGSNTAGSSTFGNSSRSGRSGGGMPADDPFATPAGAGADHVDFGALLGNVGEPSVVEDDPFGLPSGGDSDSLFGGDSDDAPFARRDSMEDNALFGDDDEDSLFLATANTSGAIFDGDDDDDDPLPISRRTDSSDEPTYEGQPRRGDDARPKRNHGPLLDRMMAIALVVLSAGVVAEYQGIPAFGLKDFLPSFGDGGQAERDATRRKAQQRPIPQNLADPTDIKDTARTYQLEVERLKKIREVRPEDERILKDLVGAYIDLLERSPGVFLADPTYNKELSALRKRLKKPSLRYGVADLLARGELLEINKRVDELIEQDGVTADDLGTAAWALWQFEQARARQDALDNPGRISNPAIDPLLRLRPDSAPLKRARELAKRALRKATAANNRLKFVMIKARIDDATGFHEENMEALTSFAPTAKDAVEAHLLLIAGFVRGNYLGKAASALKLLAVWAQDKGNDVALKQSYLYAAWLAHQRGRVDDQLSALSAAQSLDADDELTTVRLGRLYLRERRAQDCYKILSAAKKRGLKSIAFEVALVEYWLWAHRDKDALAEIKEATKNFPDAVDLLYLRGQVEEQQKHTATAQDFYSKVIAREPKHLRSALRLAILQGKAGRHDDALATLTQARRRLGPLASLLELIAKELLVLNRVPEARKIYDVLLDANPSHKLYLLNAARMDVKAGRIDSALKYLLVLRADGALDRDGAQQLAMALASKGKPGDAAKTLVQFADREPNDIRLNALSGQYMLDSGNIERAETLLKRAFRVAHRQGGDAETLFQYGRLAFQKGEISKGISRIRQAIKAAPKTHHYRYNFAKSLLQPENMKWPSAGAMAVSQLKWLISYEDRLESQGNRIDYIADVYRTLARYYFDTKRFAKAIPLLRKSLNKEPNHLATRVQLGKAFFRVSDPRAEGVLRQVLKKQPNNHLGALYLGLTLQNSGKISEAIIWLTRATRGRGSQLAEAWYQLAMIYRDRSQHRDVVRCLQAFLKRAARDDPYRADAVSQLSRLGG